MTHFTRITTLGFLIATCLATPVQAANVAGVVEHSDGSRVSQPGGAGTKIIVDIESPTGSTGTSHNQYTHFNVPSHGVELNNSTANARTIINEVTSSGSAHRTMFEGR